MSRNGVSCCPASHKRVQTNLPQELDPTAISPSPAPLSTHPPSAPISASTGEGYLSMPSESYPRRCPAWNAEPRYAPVTAPGSAPASHAHSTAPRSARRRLLGVITFSGSLG